MYKLSAIVVVNLAYCSCIPIQSLHLDNYCIITCTVCMPFRVAIAAVREFCVVVV